MSDNFFTVFLYMIALYNLVEKAHYRQYVMG